MAKRLAAIAVVVICLVVAGLSDGTMAQQPAKPKPGDPVLPAPKDGETVLTGNLDAMGLSDILKMYSETCGVSIVLADTKLLAGKSFSVWAPATGLKIKGESWSVLTGDALEFHRLALVRSDLDATFRLLADSDVWGAARFVEESEFKSVPSAEWITFGYQTKVADSNYMAGALRSLMPRLGVVQPSYGGLLMCARPGMARRLLGMCRLMDRPNPNQAMVMHYALPKSGSGEQVLRVIAELFGKEGRDGPAATASLLEKDGGVLVRARPADQEAVRQALQLMPK